MSKNTTARQPAQTDDRFRPGSFCIVRSAVPEHHGKVVQVSAWVRSRSVYRCRGAQSILHFATTDLWLLGSVVTSPKGAQ